MDKWVAAATRSGDVVEERRCCRSKLAYQADVLGEVGELVYGKIADISAQKAGIDEWVNCMTFAEWVEWQCAFRKC